MAKIDFDSTTVDPSIGRFDTIPPGRYRVQIVNSDVRPTKGGTGHYVYLEMQVVEGPFENRRLWDRINYINNNQKTQQIAQAQLRNIQLACGVEPGQMRDTEVLHFQPFMVSISVKPDAGDGYGEQNVVRYPSFNVSDQAAGQAELPIAPPVAPPVAAPPGPPRTNGQPQQPQQARPPQPQPRQPTPGAGPGGPRPWARPTKF
jgi:hypothetical protein